MSRLLLVSSLVACCISPAHAGDADRRLMTAGDAILCLTADMLPQAYEAAGIKNRSLMDQLGCFPIFAGIPAIRVDTKTGSKIWQVRLEPKDAEPMTVWAYHYAFRSDKGETLDMDGRPEKPAR